MRSDERLDTLIAGYVEGDLTAEERDELLELIESRPDAARRLLEEIDTHEAINVAAQGEEGEVTEFVRRVHELWVQELDDSVSGYYTVPAERLQRKRHARAWGVWVSVAACLAIVVGAVVYNERRAREFPERLVAHIQTTSPDVAVYRDGRTIVAVVGMDIFPGDRVETGADERVTILYRTEETNLKLEENAVLTLVEPEAGRSGRRFRLDSGTVKADVAKQPEGQPVVFVTPHAQALVKGTVLLLSVDETSTRLDVTDGVVEFTRKSDAKAIDVAGGHYAIVEGKTEFAAVPYPDADSLLTQLVEKASAAKTVADIEALKQLGRNTYVAEVRRKAGYDMRRQVWFGLALGIIAEPKRDRQVEDLRFFLEQARDTASYLSGTWSEEHREEFRLRYDGARVAAINMFYDRWNDGIRVMANACIERKEWVLLDALVTELIYVSFYERGLPGSASLIYGLSQPEVLALPGHRYLKEHIMPLADEMYAVERKLEETIDFDLMGQEAGSWEVWKVGNKETGAWAFHRIRQKDPKVKDSFVFFPKLLFDEAVLTGQAKILEFGPKPGTPVYCFGYLFDKTLHGHGPTLPMARAVKLDERWMWFRIHFMKLGGGKWTSLRWMWFEGRQPYDLRHISTAELPPPKQASVDAKLVDACGSKTVDTKKTPCIGFGTRGVAAEWRALGFEVVTPRGGLDHLRVNGQTFMTGKVIRSDDFTQGLSGWKFGLWPGPAGEKDIDWKDAKALGITVKEVNFRGTKKPGLAFTCRAPKGSRVTVSRVSGIGRKAFQVSAYVRFTSGKSCSMSLWNLAGTRAEEIKLRAGSNFTTNRYMGKWVHAVTRFVPIQGENGEPLIDCRTLLDGAITSHEIGSGTVGPVYLTIEGEARVEMTDFVVHELIPLKQREGGDR